VARPDLRWIFPLLAVFCAASATSAVAAGLLRPAGQRVDDPQVRLWLDNAARHFGRLPSCPAGITVDRYERIRHGRMMAAAPVGGCDMSLDPDYYPMPAGTSESAWAAAMCTAVAHEFGHLLGLRHSRDRRSLMYGRQDGPRPVCTRPRAGRFHVAVNRPDAWRPPPPRLLGVAACPDVLGAPQPLAFGGCAPLPLRGGR
jgi:hypothetical protein